MDAALTGSPAPEHPRHELRIDPRSRLGAQLGSHAVVNSYHHQSVARVGRGLRAVATAPDGVIEAIEGSAAGGFCLGVQWELQESWQNDPRQLGVFRLLVDAAAQRKQPPDRDARFTSIRCA